MTHSLHEAANQSNDQPDIPYVTPSTRVYTGRPGRPRIEMNPDWLHTALDIRGGTSSLGNVFGCAPRTVRRRALELGLVEPGPPVYVDYVDPEGHVTRIYRSSTRATSDIDDEELDKIMASILQVFPSLGRRMIMAILDTWDIQYHVLDSRHLMLVFMVHHRLDLVHDGYNVVFIMLQVPTLYGTMMANTVSIVIGEFYQLN